MAALRTEPLPVEIRAPTPALLPARRGGPSARASRCRAPAREQDRLVGWNRCGRLAFVAFLAPRMITSAGRALSGARMIGAMAPVSAMLDACLFGRMPRVFSV
jgi:hypothetical protein